MGSLGFRILSAGPHSTTAMIFFPSTIVSPKEESLKNTKTNEKQTVATLHVPVEHFNPPTNPMRQI